MEISQKFVAFSEYMNFNIFKQVINTNYFTFKTKSTFSVIKYLMGKADL